MRYAQEDDKDVDIDPFEHVDFLTYYKDPQPIIVKVKANGAGQRNGTMERKRTFHKSLTKKFGSFFGNVIKSGSVPPPTPPTDEPCTSSPKKHTATFKRLATRARMQSAADLGFVVAKQPLSSTEKSQKQYKVSPSLRNP